MRQALSGRIAGAPLVNNRSGPVRRSVRGSGQVTVSGSMQPAQQRHDDDHHKRGQHDLNNLFPVEQCPERDDTQDEKGENDQKKFKNLAPEPQDQKPENHSGSNAKHDLDNEHMPRIVQPPREINQQLPAYLTAPYPAIMPDRLACARVTSAAIRASASSRLSLRDPSFCVPRLTVVRAM